MSITIFPNAHKIIALGTIIILRPLQLLFEQTSIDEKKQIGDRNISVT